MRGGGVLGEVFFRSRVTGEEIGCCFRRASLGDLSKKLAVLGVEESVEGEEIVSEMAWRRGLLFVAISFFEGEAFGF